MTPLAPPFGPFPAYDLTPQSLPPSIGSLRQPVSGDLADAAVNPAKKQPVVWSWPREPWLFDGSERKITTRNSQQRRRITARNSQQQQEISLLRACIDVSFDPEGLLSTAQYATNLPCDSG